MIRKYALGPVILTLLIGLLTCMSFHWLMVPGHPPDEPSHSYRIASIAAGNFLAVKGPDLNGVPSWGGAVPQNLVNGFTEATGQRNYAPLDKSVRSPVEYIAFSNTAVYSPLLYIPGVVAYKIAYHFNFTVMGTISAMRWATTLVYLALAGLAVFVVRRSKVVWLIFVAALAPVALFEASMVTADAITNGVVILFAALIAKSVFLREHLSPAWFSGLLIVGGCLPLVKPTYAPILLLLLFIPQIRLWLRWVLTLVLFLPGLYWEKIGTSGAAGIRGLRPADQAVQVDASRQLHWILAHPGDFIMATRRSLSYFGWDWFTQSFGQLGYWHDNGNAPASPPIFAGILFLIAVILSLGIAPKMHASLTMKVLLPIGIIGIAILSYMSLYLTFTMVGHEFVEGFQGRYLFPLVPYGLLWIASIVPLRLFVITAASPKSHDAQFSVPSVSSPRFLPYWIVGCMILSLLLCVVMYATRFDGWLLQGAWPR